MPGDPIILSDYNSIWPERFREIADQLRNALGDLAHAIEHVGSTAVPGLAAKPVIDIDVVVRSADDVNLATERLQRVGYEHEGDLGIPGREAFRWPDNNMARHHLYVVVAGSQPHADHLGFRDYLRAHPAEALECSQLKRSLAAQYRGDRAKYTEEKGRFIERLQDVRSGNPDGRPS